MKNRLIFWLVVSLGLWANVANAQSSFTALRDSANALSKNGKFIPAAETYKALANEYEKSGIADSSLYYTYKSLHHFGLSGQNKFVTEEYESLISTLESSGNLPRFMSKIYFSAGSNYLYLNDFDGAQRNLQKAIDFEHNQQDTDTASLAKAIEWKGLTNVYSGDLNEASRLVEQAVTLLKASEGNDAKELGYTLNSLGLIYDENNKLQKADSAYTEALRILSIHLPPSHAHLSSVSSNISNIKMELGQFQEARQLLEKAIAIHQKEELYDPLMKEYFNLGALYLSLEDVNRGIPYVKKALALADSLLPSPHYARANFLNGLGSAYFIQGEYAKADSVFRAALEQNIELYGSEHAEIGQSYYNLGLIAQALGHFEDAAKYYEKSYKIRFVNLGEENTPTTDSYFSLGEVEWEIGDKEQALKMLEKGYSAYKKAYGSSHQSTVEAGLIISGKFLLQNKIDSARYWLNKTWEDVGAHEIGMYHSDFKIEFLDPYVLRVIEYHLQFLKQTKILKSELLWIMTRMDELMASLWPFLNSENQNAELSNRIKNIYNLSVLLGHQIVTQDKDVQSTVLNALSESRYATIRSAIQNREAMQFANVPDSVLDKDRKLREKIRYIKAKQREEGDEKWEELAFEAVEEWRNWQRSLESKYPRWYGIRYSQQKPSLEKLQKYLDKRTFLAYTYLDSICIATLVSDKAFKTVELATDDLAEDISRLNTLILKQNTGERFVELSSKVYAQILGSVESELSKDVIIMPDGPLYYLSFESLLSKEPKNNSLNDWPWLIKDYTVRFANTIPGQGKAKPRSSSGIVAFIPGFDDKLKSAYEAELKGDMVPDSTFLSWVRTPWSVKLASDLPGSPDVFIGVEANEKNFRMKANDASILHFGTHAVLRDDNPLNSYLVLTPQPANGDDGYVFAHELYNQPISADLALLTACETGLGQFSAGEGVLSLGHAFQYAGCPSVIYSLWKIDDQQSSAILKLFYNELDNGLSYSEALHKAKLDYLASSHTDLAAPYYWSGIVLTGEDGKLENSRPVWMYIAGGLVLLALLLIIIRWVMK